MKRFLFFLFLSSLGNNLFAEISVKSFRKLDSDMSARIDAPKKDQNGDACAIIKIVTTQTGFLWEPDGLGIMSQENKGGEYWLYVPYGAKRLTIKHPQLGVLRDYMYPMPIEKACVYELVLTTGKVITTVEEEIESQWLLIKAQPAKAMIYLNEQFVKAGEYQAKLKPGKYPYRVEAPLYRTEAGIVEITDSKKVLNVELKPAFGFLNITTMPESGAMVMIDGKEQLNPTPYLSDPMASGEHTVQVIKEMYQPTAQKVTVSDGQTTPINIEMQPNFAELTLTAPPAAMLFVNNKWKATGNWNGRLNPGIYSLEAILDKHRNAKQDIEVVAGDKKKIDLQPTPIYGSLDVLSTPSGAAISINGKEYGTTPTTVNKLLIGNCIVTISKDGYGIVKKKISILEGKTAEVNETLSNGRMVTINSNPNGLNLFIDGNALGATPFKGSLTFGNHTLRIEKDGEDAEKNVSISQTGGEINYMLSFGLPPVTDIDKNIYKTVKIGNQIWMAENLRTTHYRNGVEIPMVKDSIDWGNLTTGAYCDYENKSENGNKYGHLYNFYSVSDKQNIAPLGWHIPTKLEWDSLANYLVKNGYNYDGSTTEKHGFNPRNNTVESGVKFFAKSLAANIDWKIEGGVGTVGNDLSSNNKTGFAALPGGARRFKEPCFMGIFREGWWWSSTEEAGGTLDGKKQSKCFYIGSYSSSPYFGSAMHIEGLYIRCIKDE
ncbi:MAG: PEGA domain-containing protein [Bacteroidales bacterium]